MEPTQVFHFGASYLAPGCARVIAPYRKKGGVLQAQQVDYNGVHSHYRARAEHLFGRLDKFALISTRWERVTEEGAAQLQRRVHVLLHLINFDLWQKFLYLPLGPSLYKGQEEEDLVTAGLSDPEDSE